jgi:hypothetical protein
VKNIPLIRSAKKAFERQSERLKAEVPFQTWLLFIPFLAVVVLTVYTSVQMNGKLFSMGRPVEMDGAPVADKEIWLSIGIRNDLIVIATPEGKFFSWPISGPDTAQLALLQDYLTERARYLVSDSVRRGQLSGNHNSAALSVDQSLTYQHVRPIIYALAGAGFSRYGFETRIVR